MKPSRVLGLVLALGALLAIVVLYLNRPGVPDEDMPLPAPRIESPAPAPGSAVESSTPPERVRALTEPIPTPQPAASPQAPSAGPVLWGSVTVDGERRIPADIEVIVDSVVVKPELDRGRATYALPRSGAKPSKVVVTSSESVVCNLTVPSAGPDGNWRLDLPLVSGRVLYVHVIDAPSGAAAADQSLALDLSVLQESTVKMRSFRTQALTAKTDGHGDCTFHGLPQEGRATLRDPKRPRGPEKPLLDLRLAPDSPSEFHETVYVNSAPATVTGKLPNVANTLRVQRARIDEGGRSTAVEGSAAVDANSNWSFECEVPSDWRVWLADGTARVSQIEEVHVTQAKNYGPIQLQLVQASELHLHFVNAPTAGTVDISIVEDAGDPYRSEDVPITARELDHTLRLHGPARLTVRCKAGKQMSVAESRQLLSVDPSRTPELTVDLHGDRVRGVTLTLNGEAPQGETVLPFVGLDTSGNPTREGVIFHLLDGKGRDPVPVVAGTYLYILQSDTSRGAIYGTVHVPDSAEPVVLRLEWKGVAVPRASLGTGIEFESIEDVSGANWIEGLRQLRWPKSWGPEVTSLLVPEHCKYKVLP